MSRMKLAASCALIRSTGWQRTKDEREAPDRVDPSEYNYEALVFFDGMMEHCIRNNRTAEKSWDHARIQTAEGELKVKAASPIIIRPTQGDVVRRNFDALMVLEDNSLWHFVCFDGERSNWTRAVKVCDNVTGTPSLVTGQNYNESYDYFRDLHAFVPVGGNIEYYRCELREADYTEARRTFEKLKWIHEGTVCKTATGDPSAIITGDGDDGSIEVLVPEGGSLVHYSLILVDFRPLGLNPIGVSLFTRREVVTDQCDGAAAFVELRSLYLHYQMEQIKPWAPMIQAKPDYHILVPCKGQLVHYYRSNMLADVTAWTRGQVVADRVSGPAAMMETIYGQQIISVNMFVPSGKVEAPPPEVLFNMRDFLSKNGNLDVILVIGDDLYFTYCEIVGLTEFKWHSPVMII